MAAGRTGGDFGGGGGGGGGAIAAAEDAVRPSRKVVVGGTGTAVDYKVAERAFHQRDVPPAAATARLEVKTALAAAANPRAWNPTTLVTSKCERMSTQLRAFDRPVYRLNLRAEWLPPPRHVETDIWGRITRLVPDEVRCGDVTRDAPTTVAATGRR